LLDHVEARLRSGSDAEWLTTPRIYGAARDGRIMTLELPMLVGDEDRRAAEAIAALHLAEFGAVLVARQSPVEVMTAAGRSDTTVELVGSEAGGEVVDQRRLVVTAPSDEPAAARRWLK
jgi:poly(3-hydroxybutyrate) depolymerase